MRTHYKSFSGLNTRYLSYAVCASFFLLAHPSSCFGKGRSFQGIYGGASASLSRARLAVDGLLFSANAVSLGGTLGAGFIWKDYYFGAECNGSTYQARMKKPLTRLSMRDAYAVLVRFGTVLRENFLPFAGLGVGTLRYRYTSPRYNTSFRAKNILPTVGVDAFVTNNFLIRSSLRYTVTSSFSKKNSSLPLGKRPQRFSLEIGAFYKF